MKCKGLLVVLVAGMVWLPFLSYGEDLSALRQKAEQGDAKAQSVLGACYYNGQGVPQDYKEAIKWYRLAAEQGDVSAQNVLGAVYYMGQGVPRDYAEAMRWYRLAAEQGNVLAQSILGACYYNGEVVPQDYKEAVKWFRLAAEQGDVSAQNILEFCYAHDQGVRQDYKESAKQYRPATEQGNTEAQNKLRAVGGTVQDVSMVVAEQGNTEAQNKPKAVDEPIDRREDVKQVIKIMYGENWPVAMAVSFILTWGIGLTPPLLIRFTFMKRALSRTGAIGIAFLFLIINASIFNALGSKTRTHAALYLVAWASYGILRKGHPMPPLPPYPFATREGPKNIDETGSAN